MPKERLPISISLITISLLFILLLAGCTPRSNAAKVEITPTVKPVEKTATPQPTLPPVPGSETFSELLQVQNGDILALWEDGIHADTQADVASELAEERSGQAPEDVLHGDDAEDCLACHAPTAILAHGGMSDTQTLSYFFTTEDGKFTADTAPMNTSEWPDISCTACHNVPEDYPNSPAPVGLFDSQTGKYLSMNSTSELCGQCHGNLRFETDHLTFETWANSMHSDTQADVAGELAVELSGVTPDEVINGEEPENCIACHAPTAVLANGGMDVATAMGYFFTTTDGTFTIDTAPDHNAEWPSIACTACHDQHNPDKPSYFDPETKTHVAMGSSSELCGQCHGSLRFPDTDHLTYDAWTTSSHSDTQADVASELAEERSGETADEVVQGEDPENCIACHAPTAVLANGGMNEVQALSYFFTASDGAFTSDTAPVHNEEWPSISCTACHDQHNPDKPAYFNSETNVYDPVASADELCGQCHGSLRFPDTDHLSYDIRLGTGAINVPDQQTMPIAACTNCHMFVSGEDASNSSMQHGHSWAITVEEANGESSFACAKCHLYENADAALVDVETWQTEFQSLYDTAEKNVMAADEALQESDNADLQAKLEEALHNFEFAGSDESGGFHNHKYLMAVLTDANQRAVEILAALGK